MSNKESLNILTEKITGAPGDAKTKVEALQVIYKALGGTNGANTVAKLILQIASVVPILPYSGPYSFDIKNAREGIDLRGKTMTDAIMVNIVDANLVPENIKSGVDILGVIGTYV